MAHRNGLRPVFRFGFSNAVKTDRFPEKLYDVVEDNYVIRWGADGTSIFVDENGFAEIIMECYPGFLQIPDFPNFRRLFREYSFDWENRDSIFEFSHPCFIRGKPELLGQILTRRKSYYKKTPAADKRRELPDYFDVEFNSETPGRMTRRGFIPLKSTEKQKNVPEKIIFDEKKAYKIHERPSLTKYPEKEEIENENSQDQCEDEKFQKGSFEENRKAIENIINVFAINELSPEEFLEYLQRRRSTLESNSVPMKVDNSATTQLTMSLIKPKDETQTTIPSTSDYQLDNVTFTQIRSELITSPTDEFVSPNKNYHMMRNFNEPSYYNYQDQLQNARETIGDSLNVRASLQYPCCECRCHYY
ncbi:hypothetical protein SNE40_008591 [Patella caerulea]|uniref:HSF-type DNA-binding domain-containing protein n=1 Tax=Patella caerulea TaxID=87958 RepID=A0AAN8K1H0_PATCE